MSDIEFMCQQWLAEWTLEYKIKVCPDFMGFKVKPNSPPRPKRHWVRAWVSYKPYPMAHTIYIHPWFKNHPLLCKAELWHEFCHVLSYELCHGTGHGKEWRKFRREKVLLWVLDLFF